MSDWRPIKSAPKDGSRFLAWCVMDAEEFDEDDRKLGDVTEEYAVVAYYLFGGFVQFPFGGGIPQNIEFTHWRPLPAPPPKRVRG